MSAPRQILPGTTYMVSRRVSQRFLWLLPSLLVNRIVLYCIAVAAARIGLEVHAVCVMSNHIHAVVTDVTGRLPEYTHWSHEFIGKCINALYKRFENMWSSDEPCYEALMDEESILNAIVYVLANPVEAGLVKRSRLWPGLITKPQDIVGVSYPVSRPPVFFRERGRTPADATLTITRPPIYPELSDDELAALIARRLLAKERKHVAAHKAAGRTILGVEGVLRQRPDSQPRSEAPRFRRRPRFAATSRTRLRAAARQRREFEARHKLCRQLLLEGRRDVVFPAGTYAMRRFAGVAVEDAGFV